MSDTNFYENLILQAIASNLGLSLNSLRLLPTVKQLPQDNHKLFNLFDIIPSNRLIFKTNNGASRLSNIYGELLQSQKESFLSKFAHKNFKNPKNWLSLKTPLYNPSFSGICDAMTRGSSFDFELNSANHSFNINRLYPSFPSFIVNQSFLTFNQIAEGEKFILKLHFDKLVKLPVRPGSWFSQPLFTHAFQNKEDWTSEQGEITWNSLFGDNGILQFICNGMIATSGMRLEIQSFGKYNESILNTLKNDKNISIWPFYLSSESLVKDYVLCQDGSIQFSIQTPPTEILLLALEAANVKTLLGYSS